jgi:xanthine dehydrogenase accessory factor
MGFNYEESKRLIDKGESYVCVTILEKYGSAPRGIGTKMIIEKDLSIIGTIGGGIFEALTIKEANTIFKTKKSKIKNFFLSNKDASIEGMVCGGDLRVLIEFIDVQNENIKQIYSKANELSDKGEDFVMVTEICDNSCNCKWICTESNFYGKGNDDVEQVFRSIRENFKDIKVKCMNVNNNQYLIEPHFNIDTIYILGAGHVAHKLAKLTSFIGFRTVILDDRQEFCNKERFPFAYRTIVLESFDNAFKNIEIDNNSYIVIVTRAHLNDKEVLAQALKTNCKYIGMIGSKKKRKFIYDELLKMGYAEQELNKVYSPIGLSIGAQTPEEIAVSIAAELIEVRRG